MQWNLGQTVPARAGDPTADTNNLLKAEMRRRQIPLRGRIRKVQFVDALQTSDREDSATYRAWSDRREAQMKQEERNE
jgi:hypothetical protein